MRTIVPVELVGQNIRKLVYQFLVDLDNDGVYETDLTSDCTIDYVNLDLELKNPGEVLGKPSTSNASVTLFNETGRYSPKNSKFIETEHTGWKFRRNTKVRILAGFVDTNGTPQTQELFQGVITNYRTSVKDKKVTLTLKDFAKFLQKKKNPNHTLANGIYYEGALFDSSISDAVSYLLDFGLGASYPRNIDELAVKFPCIEFPADNNIWATLQKLAEACNAKMYFEGGYFNFYTGMSAENYNPEVSQYTFIADNIFELTESIDEENLVNKWIIESDGKTLQPRQVIVGTPSTNVLTAVETYKTDDGKNALDSTRKIITLKSQDEKTEPWIDTINVPLVDATTYSDLLSPDQDDIDKMNADTTLKVWDMINNKQLTVQDVDCKTGQIVLVDAIPTGDYSLQISYQYRTDRILTGKHKFYEYSFDKISRNIEMPEIEAHDTIDLVIYSSDSPTNALYLSDWEVLDGNQRVKFKLTNNVPSRQLDNDLILDTVYISKMNIYGNPLDCVSHLKIIAEDATTLAEFENSYSISNDYIIDSDWGQKLADYYLFRNKSDKAYIDITTKGIPQLQLNDRVTLIESNTGHSDDFVVIAIKHTPRIDGWKTAVSLEALTPTWTYDSNNTSVVTPVFDPGSILTLPVVDILSNEAFEDVFADNAITHSVVINFTRPSQLNITDFMEGKVLCQEYHADTTSWGRYITVGSFNDSYTSQYKINNLLPDKQYKFYIVATNRRNNQSPYGDGYLIKTPTTTELKANYSIISAPTTIQLIKGMNQTVSVTFDSCSLPHYKNSVVQMVIYSLPWTDSSVQTKTVAGNNASFTFPTEDIYKFRVYHTDIWDRKGSYSTEQTLSGAKLDISSLPNNILEISATSNPAPTTGTVDSLTDGTSASAVFASNTTIIVKYPNEHEFDCLRIRTPQAVSFYAQYIDDSNNAVNVIGTSGTPAITAINTLSGDFSVFHFKLNGDLNGTDIKRTAKELRLILPSGGVIEELEFTTFGYFSTLVVKDGEIQSAMIHSLSADKLTIGDAPANIPLAINSTTDILFHFDVSLISTGGIKPIGLS